MTEILGGAFEVQQEIAMPFFYKTRKVEARRVDLLIKKKVVVELKATTTLDDNHLAQSINYPEAFDLEAGLLINFGSKSLPYKRVIHPKFIRKKNHSDQ